MIILWKLLKIKKFKNLLILFIICYYLFISIVYGYKIYCFYYDENYDYGLTKNSCIIFNKTVNYLFNDTVNMILFDELNNYLSFLNGSNVIVYLSGFGDYKHIWISPDGKNKLTYCELLDKINPLVLIVDTCYSGGIFNCENYSKIPIIITSTNDVSVSTNIPLNGKLGIDGYVSSLSLTLYILFTQDEQFKSYNLIGCYESKKDPQVCQLSIIMKLNGIKDDALKTLYTYKKLHPNISIGTLMINNNPWRNF